VRRDKQLSSDEADEPGAAGELSGEVHDILTMQGPTSRSALQDGWPNGATGCRSVVDNGQRAMGELVDSREVVSFVAPVDWETGSWGRAA